MESGGGVGGGGSARRIIGDTLREDLDGYYGPGSILIIASGSGIRRCHLARTPGTGVREAETTIREVSEDYKRSKSDKMGRGGEGEKVVRHTLLAPVGVAQLL